MICQPSARTPLLDRGWRWCRSCLFSWQRSLLQLRERFSSSTSVKLVIFCFSAGENVALAFWDLSIPSCAQQGRHLKSGLIRSGLAEASRSNAQWELARHSKVLRCAFASVSLLRIAKDNCNDPKFKFAAINQSHDPCHIVILTLSGKPIMK